MEITNVTSLLWALQIRLRGRERPRHTDGPDRGNPAHKLLDRFLFENDLLQQFRADDFTDFSALFGKLLRGLFAANDFVAKQFTLSR